MSKLFLACALLATIAIGVQAQSYTFTLSGTIYSDSACTTGAKSFSTATTYSGASPVQTCTPFDTQYVEGYCIPAGYAGSSSTGGWGVYTYANSTCNGVPTGQAASDTPDTTKCIALFPSSAGYVKFGACSSASTIAVSSLLLVALAYVAQQAKNLF